MTDRIHLAQPHMVGNEIAYLRECITSNYVSSVGPFVERFEREFASYVGSPHAVACASGTAALHVALQLGGAGPGVTVAVSSFTFIAPINAITYTGATPLLVDSEPQTWNMNTELLLEEVTRRAKRGLAIPEIVEAVHILGHPIDMEPLLELRSQYGTVIVEDAAEALGASYTTGRLSGRQVGTVGDLGCFSFNGNKIMTTGNGGMIVTSDNQMAKRARHLTTQAKLPGTEYVHDGIGYNYRLSNLASALGVAQLEQLDSFLNIKRQNAAEYDSRLAGLPLALPPSESWAHPSFWLYSVLTDGDERDTVLAALNSEGVEARPLWPPIHQQIPYGHLERLGGDVSDDLYRRGLSLPSSVGLDSHTIRRVTHSLERALHA